MIHVHNKENIPRNHIANRVQHVDKDILLEPDLGCYPLSESEEENINHPQVENTGGEITEEYLDQAEKCLLDIENYEDDEEVKMQLINQLYQHIQLQRQGVQEAAPMTYEELKKQVQEEERGYLVPATEENRREHTPEENTQQLTDEAFINEFLQESGLQDDLDTSPALEPDDIAIIKPHKTFAELLEDELAKEEVLPSDRELMPPPPDKLPAKRQFLKRGQGIARFNSAPMRKPQKPKTVMKPDSNIPAPKRTVGIIRSNTEPGRTNKLPGKIKIDAPMTIVPNKGPVKTCQTAPVMSPVRTSPSKSPEHSISNRLKPSHRNKNEISGFLNPEQVEERIAAEEEELEEFRMLEQAAADRSINSLIGMLKLSTPAGNGTPACQTIQEKQEENGEENGEEEEELEDDEDFDDNETWGFRTPVKPSTNLDDLGGDTAEGEEARPSKLLSSLFPGLKPPPPPAKLEETAERKSDPEYDELKLELKAKLAELEREVARFQKEAAGLARARADKESELRRLREENEQYVVEQEEKEKKFQEYKDRELKIIRAEKKQFEMTQLSSRQRAAKLELVDSLTERVEALEAELSRKEERWNSTFTRLKNKTDSKEEECNKLHSQITVLEKDKLAMWEKEVERTGNRRHRGIQTEQTATTAKEVIKTEGMATTAEATIKPSLKARHPDIDWEGPNKNVKFSESESGYVNLYHNASPASQRPVSREPTNQSAVSVPRDSKPTNQSAVSVPRDSKPANQSAVSREQCHSPASDTTTTPNSRQPASETVGPDGSVTMKYGNGTVKHISADGTVVTMTYFNGDTKQTYQGGKVVYKFLKDGITQTQFPNGIEKTVFSTGQEETRYPDNRVEIKYPDNSTKMTYSNGEEKSIYADGTVVTVDKSGQRLIVLPNGQREVHTSTLKRREYPDGTSKTVYNDGRQETVHANGRRRKKDCRGKLVEDVVVDARGTVIHDYLTGK